MRGARILVAALGCALGLGVADGGQAGVLAYRGTLSLELAGGGESIATLPLAGSGVATVNGSGGNGHLGALHLDAGLQTTGTIAVPITDPDVIQQGIVEVRATQLSLGASFPLTFEHLGGSTDVLTDPGGGGGVLPVRGLVVICIVTPDCNSFFSIPLTAGGTRGLGIGGGLLTISGFAQTGLHLSVQGNPWTVGTASVAGVSTPGGTGTATRRGFVHGPLSQTSSTAKPSGVVQLVTPVIISTNLQGGLSNVALFGTLRLHFVPEPGTLLLLGSGVAGLAVLTRRRL